jgi:hypothetical protein
MARKTPPGKSAATPQAGERLIAIRAHDGDNELIEQVVMRKAGPAVVRMAMHWGYILRVRTRWAGDPDMRDYFGTKAVDDLAELGIPRETVQRFAAVKHIEIELYKWEPAGADTASIVDAASEIPWEYLLSAATRSVGRFQSLLVTRCFANGSMVTPRRPRNVLFVESAPGRVEQEYDFDDEEKRIVAAVNVEENGGLKFARTEPLSKLKDLLGSKAWEAIHVTGVDTHQVAWLIEDFYDAVARKADVIDTSDHLHDGMILRGDQESELPVRYDQLADLLLESKEFPYAITLNLYYSGARTARELVRRGAYAALGFLDEIEDEFAERFFQAFYWEWCHRNKSIPQAFLNAWSTMDSDRMHGTAIVIWLGRSMVGQPDTPARKPRPKSAAKSRTGAR